MTYLQLVTDIHVAISLVAIGAGFLVFYGFLVSNRLDRWTSFFLWTTVLTSATGFLFPVDHFMPSHAIAILSLVVLGVAIYARYSRRLAGIWCAVFVVTALVAQYLNVFVLIIQSFMKVPALKALAPTQSEPPFAIAQGVVLVLFLIFGTLATIRFKDRSNFI